MKKLSQKEYEKRVYFKHGNDIKVLGGYVNRRTKILVKCKCGYEWKTNPEPLTKGHGCPKCAKNLKRNTDDFKQIVNNLVADEYEVLGKYENKDKPIKFKHKLCGNEFMMSPNAFINGQRCPNERYTKSANSNTTPFEQAKREMIKATNGEYEIIDGYKGSSKFAKIKHTKCGNTFNQKPTRITKGGIGCPYCYVSKGENVIRDYLIDNGYNFKEQVRIKECRNKRPLPFDFGVYNGDILLFLIEFDGIQHFKPKFGIKQLEDTQRNDNIKNDFCRNKNIPLIRIKYYRSSNPIKFREKIIERLEKTLLNMTIPSEAIEKSIERVTTR